MQIIVLAQNVPYLVNGLGVPQENAQEVLDYLMTFDKNDRPKVVRHLKKNPAMSLDELKKFKVFSEEDKLAGFSPEVVALAEKLKVRPETVDWAFKNKISPQVLEWSASINPKFVEWLCKMVANESITSVAGEDDDSIRNTVKKFELLRRKMDVPKEYKDINYYKTYTDLEEAISTLMVEEKSDEPPVADNDPHLVYNDNDIKVLKYSGAKDTNELYQKTVNTNGVKWCTGRSDYTAKDYLNRGAVYLIYFGQQRTALFHYESHQLKRRDDQTIQDFHVISALQPVLEKLGIAPEREAKADYGYRDETVYYKIFDLGKEIRDKMDKAPDKGVAVAELQRQKEAARTGIGMRDEYNQDTTKNFGPGINQQHILSYLNDSDFEDASVQTYATQIYESWIRDVTDLVDFEKIYKKTPFGLRLVPAVRQTNLKEFIHFIDDKIRALGGYVEETYGEEVYRAAGREIKVFKEFQEAYERLWVAKVGADPELYTSKLMPKKFKGRFEQIHRQAILQKLAFGPVDVNASFPAYNDLSPELKKDPEIQAAIRKGWLDFAGRFPMSYALIPNVWQNEPDFIEKERFGWMLFLNGQTSIKLAMLAKVPARVKATQEYKDFERLKVLPAYAKAIKKDPNAYVMIPEEIRANPSFSQIVEKMAINLMDLIKSDNPENMAYQRLPLVIRQLPRVAKVEQLINIPLWTKLIGMGNTDIFNRLSQETKADPRITQAVKPGWVAKLTNPNARPLDLITISRQIPESIAQLPEIVALYNQKLLPAWAAYVQANPQMVGTIPPAVRNNPKFITDYKRGVITQLNALPANAPTTYKNLIIPEIQNDPAIQRAIQRFNWTERGAFGSNWYSMHRTASAEVEVKIAKPINYERLAIELLNS